MRKSKIRAISFDTEDFPLCILAFYGELIPPSSLNKIRPPSLISPIDSLVYRTVNRLLPPPPPRAYLFQTGLGGGEYKKLEVMQPSIKNKSELPTRE